MAYRATVHRLRTSFLGQSWLAALIVACAMLVRVLVPAGFMPVADHGRVAIVICSGHGPMMAMAHHGTAGHASKQGNGHDFEHQQDAQHVCPYAVASLSCKPSFDGSPLGQRINVSTAIPNRIVARPLAPRPRGRWRPPLRAPPQSA